MIDSNWGASKSGSRPRVAEPSRQSPGSSGRTSSVEAPMRKILVVIAILQFALSGAVAQSESAARAEMLSLEQKTKISQIISTRTEPLGSGKFAIAVDAMVPADIQIHSLPPEAEQV